MLILTPRSFNAMSSLSSPLGRLHLADPRSTPNVLALDRLPKLSALTKLLTGRTRKSDASAATKASIRLVPGSCTSDSRVVQSNEWGVRTSLPPTYADSLRSPTSSTSSHETTSSA